MKRRLQNICLGWLVFAACEWLAQAQTNQIFLETMGTTDVNPWTGGFSDNLWLVTGNSFTLATSWNCSADTNANSCGLQFKQGTANLTDSMIATASGIGQPEPVRATGTSQGHDADSDERAGQNLFAAACRWQAART